MATQNSWNSKVLADAVTLNGGAVAIGSDATDNAINIGTGADTGRTVTIGNLNCATAVDVITGAGGASITTTGNSNITLWPAGSGVVSVNTSCIVPTADRANSLGSATNSWDNVYADGLSFDGGANILAKYKKETTFTPVLNFGEGTTGITYATQTGKYTRIGNFVILHIHVALTSKGTDVGIASVTGALAAASATPALITPDRITYANTLLGLVNGTTILFQNVKSGSVPSHITNAGFANNSQFKIACTYFV